MSDFFDFWMQNRMLGQMEQINSQMAYQNELISNRNSAILAHAERQMIELQKEYRELIKKYNDLVVDHAAYMAQLDVTCDIIFHNLDRLPYTYEKVQKMMDSAFEKEYANQQAALRNFQENSGRAV